MPSNSFGHVNKRSTFTSSSSKSAVGSFLFRRVMLNMTYGTISNTPEFYSYPFIVTKKLIYG